MTPLPDEVLLAMRREGIADARVTPVSRWAPESKYGRRAYRVDVADGRTVKVRRFEDEATAQEVCAVRHGIPVGYGCVLARHGSVLIEEWVEGALLDEATAEPYARVAGRLLGALHTTKLPDGVAPVLRTDFWRENARDDLAFLRGGGHLERATADLLTAVLDRPDPAVATAARIHLDFCPENLILGPAGELTVVDNEWTRIGAPAFDLARTFNRWPMPPAVWERFLDGYGAVAPAPEAFEFWRAAATLFSARIELLFSPEKVPSILGALEVALA
jgi:aminoglycoside phosphotransferase (APT) family kinase protein